MVNIILKKTLSKIYIWYLEFVYKTSRITNSSNLDFVDVVNSDRFVIAFWHGESYCFYPLIKKNNAFVFTTVNGRGEYIANIAMHFGYTPIRVPDTYSNGEMFFKIKKQLSNNKDYHIIMTLDGPVGPYHEPKDFPLIIALTTRRKILPVAMNIKYKVQLNKRWDKYTIPLPFNKIDFFINLPIEISKEDMKEEFMTKKDKIKEVMKRENFEKITKECIN